MLGMHSATCSDWDPPSSRPLPSYPCQSHCILTATSSHSSGTAHGTHRAPSSPNPPWGHAQKTNTSPEARTCTLAASSSRGHSSSLPPEPCEALSSLPLFLPSSRPRETWNLPPAPSTASPHNTKEEGLEESQFTKALPGPLTAANNQCSRRTMILSIKGPLPSAATCPTTCPTFVQTLRLPFNGATKHQPCPGLPHEGPAPS